MLENINAIQSHLTPEGRMTSLTDRYIKESLSNLGQRIGLKGDSVVNSTLITDIWKATYNNGTDSVDIWRKTPINGVPVAEQLTSEVFSDYVSLNVTGADQNGFIEVSEYCGDFNYFLVDFISKLPLTTESTSYVYFLRPCQSNGTPLLDYDGWCFVSVNENGALDEALYYVNHSLNYFASEVSGNRKYTSTDAQFTFDYEFVSQYFDDIKTGDKSIYAVKENILTDLGASAYTMSSSIDSRDAGAVKYFYTVLFKYIKSKYNNIKYYKDDKTLVDSIICRLVKKLAIDSNKLSTTTDTVTVIFPVDYAFNVVRNDNSGIIYNSYDFQCRFSNAELDGVTQSQASTYDFITCEGTETKYSGYNFIASYVDDKFIDSINVNNLYILPYINESTNTWYINGEDSQIRATGEDAGQPNILVIQTRNTESGQTSEVSFTNKEFDGVFDQTTIWDAYTFTYNLNEVQTGDSASGASEVIPMQLPRVNDANRDAIENALIISVADTSIKGVADSIKITTFWKYDSAAATPGYICIADNDRPAYALDLSTMVGLAPLTEYFLNTQYAPDKYIHNWIVFRQKAVGLKNNTEADNTNPAYPIIGFGVYNTTSPDSKNEGVMIPFFGDDTTVTFDEVHSISDVSLANQSVRWFDKDSIITAKDTNDNSVYIPSRVPNTSSDKYAGIIPIMDMGELFINHPTVLNRVNFLISDNNNTIYNVYIGRNSDSDVDAFEIGSSSINKSLGKNTLVTDNAAELFNKITKLKLSFDNTEITGEVGISGGLTVDSESTFNENVSINDGHDLTVSGNATINGEVTATENLTVSKNITAGEFISSGKPQFTWFKSVGSTNYYSAVISIYPDSSILQTNTIQLAGTPYMAEATATRYAVKLQNICSLYRITLGEGLTNLDVTCQNTNNILIRIICTKSTDGEYTLVRASEIYNDANLSVLETILK